MPDIQTIATLLSAPQTSSGSEFLTAEEQRRILAFQQLQKMAGATNMPIYNKGTGMLKVATGALGGFLEGQTERNAAAAQAKNAELSNQWLKATFGGIDPTAAPPPLPPPPVSSGGGGGDMGMPGGDMGGGITPPVDTPAPPPPMPTPPIESAPMASLGPPAGSFGPVPDSSQQDAILAEAERQGITPGAGPETFHHVADAPRIVPIPSPPQVGAPGVYDPSALNPIDAAVASPAEKFAAGTEVGVTPQPSSIAPVQVAPAPLAPATMPGDMDRGMLFDPTAPRGLSEGTSVLPNAAVKPVPIGPNGEVSTLAPSSPMANDPIPRPPGDIPNLTPAQSIRQGLIQRGIPAHVADGFIMNFKDESGLDPGLNEAKPLVPGSRGGFGLAQWTGERRVELEHFAKETGRPVNDVNMQLDFLVKELKGSEAGAGQKILSAQTPQDAAVVIAKDFLRPATQYLNRRVEHYRHASGLPSDSEAGTPPTVTQTAAQAAQPQSGPPPQVLAQALHNPPTAPAGPSRESLVLGMRLMNDPRTPPAMRNLIAGQLSKQMTPQTPININGLLVDPRNPQHVIADYRQPQRSHIDAGNEIITFENGKEVSRIPKTRDPLDAESKQLDVQTKRKALEKPNIEYMNVNGRVIAVDKNKMGPGFDATPPTAPGQDTVTGPDGKQIPIPPGQNPQKFRDAVTTATAEAAVGKKNEVQAKSEKFGNAMELAERNLRPIEAEGLKAGAHTIDNLPFVGGTAATNYFQSEKHQQYNQAKSAFLSALLRSESGAVIGTSEYVRKEKELFPQPGDKPAQIEQKRIAREIAIEGMKKEAGPGYKSPEFGKKKTSSGITWSVE